MFYTLGWVSLEGKKLKKEMTSFDIAAITYELNEGVKDAHIAKIYQIGTHTLLLKLRRPDQPKLHLLIEAGKRLHLTSYVHETPKKPSSFCMALRKYLDNGVIKEVRQHEFERIATIEIGTRQGYFQLVSEFFGGGNVILVNPEGKILHAMTYKRMRDRNILRGEIFQQPPGSGKNPLKLKLQDFVEIQELGQKEIVRALTKFLSISGTYAEEILLRAEINKKTQCATLTKQQLESIFIELQKLLSLATTGDLEPRIVIDEDGVYVDVTPVQLKKCDQFEQKELESFNRAIDDYYAKLTSEEMIGEAAEEVEDEVSRYQRIRKRQAKALDNLKEPIAKNKNIGDLIYLHFGDFQSLLQKIAEKKNSGKSWEEIIALLEKGKKANQIPDVYFHSLEPSNQVLHVSVDNQVFSINLRHSTQDNANKYYSRSKKAEKKLKGAEKTLHETEAKIEELEKHVELAKATQQPLIRRRKKKWFEKFRWFSSSDGLLVIGGRDATTNELLIKKHMEPHDLVFHAEILGAPFVLIKTEGKTSPERTLGEAAQQAASYSRAWREMLTTLNVYWINPHQVSKTPPSGQFLKKGSFMIRGKKHFIRGVPLRIALGAKIGEDEIRVIGGPVAAINSQTDVYVEIVPGDLKSSQLAKQIRHQLSTKVSEDLKRSITAIPIEEIQRFIPSGRGKITA
jgi:predicted ribosome quality control (RQC) complex YloA/Tae2 family protein